MRHHRWFLLTLLSPAPALAEGPLPGPTVGGAFLLSLGAWGSAAGKGAWIRLRVPFDLGTTPPALAATQAPAAPEAREERPRVAAARLRKLQRAAWRSAGLEGFDRARLAARARYAALLPEVRLRGMRSNDQALRYSPLSEDDLRAQATGQAGTLYEVRVDFRLDRLVFSGDEVAIERLQQEYLQQRQRVTERLTALLGAWHREAARAAHPELPEEERREAEAAVQAAEEALDLLTDGVWSATR